MFPYTCISKFVDVAVIVRVAIMVSNNDNQRLYHAFADNVKFAHNIIYFILLYENVREMTTCLQIQKATSSAQRVSASL